MTTTADQPARHSHRALALRVTAVCALITMVPPVLLALIAQRYIMRGLTLGGERVTARGDAARRCGHWSVYGMP